MTRLTAEKFLEDVKDHQMIIQHTDGYNRSVLFKKPDTGNRHFTITTWNNHLCISGDMGTYVFSRIKDMVYFFGPTDKETGLSPNFGYWTEKLQSISIFGTYGHGNEAKLKEVSIDKTIKETMKLVMASEYPFEDYFKKQDVDDDEDYIDLENNIDEEKRNEFIQDLVDVSTVDDFEHVMSDISDEWYNFLEYDVSEHYEWILYALEWGCTKIIEHETSNEETNDV